MAVFRDEQAVAERLNNNPGEFVALLESLLTIEQVSEIERTLFPAPTNTARRTALEKARLTLIRAGVPAEDSAVSALDSEIGAIVVESA